jgi:hypothetical protein
VIETIGLGLVVDLWNLHWLPLYAVFVDWDALIAWIRRRPFAAAVPPPDWQPRKATRIFIVAFVAYDAITALIPGLDQRLNTYPFSGFPMFATVLAHAPYGDHQAYTVVGDHFQVTSDPPIDLPTQRWFDHSNRGLHDVRDPDQLHARLTAVLAQAHKRYPDYAFKNIRLYLTLFEAPAYPAPAHFESHPIAVLGELASDGTYRTLLGSLDEKHVTLRPRGVDTQGAVLAYYRDDVATSIALPASRAGDVWTLDTAPDGDPIYVVATMPDGVAWLVASRAGWKWQ